MTELYFDLGFWHPFGVILFFGILALVSFFIGVTYIRNDTAQFSAMVVLPFAFILIATVILINIRYSKEVYAKRFGEPVVQVQTIDLDQFRNKSTQFEPNGYRIRKAVAKSDIQDFLFSGRHTQAESRLTPTGYKNLKYIIEETDQQTIRIEQRTYTVGNKLKAVYHVRNKDVEKVETPDLLGDEINRLQKDGN